MYTSVLTCSANDDTPDMGLRSGTAIIFCINAKDDELCEAVPDVR
jgi:hypothetical protein